MLNSILSGSGTLYKRTGTPGKLQFITTRHRVSLSRDFWGFSLFGIKKFGARYDIERR
jgi:hypothetical protein